VESLLEYLAGGDSIDDVLAEFSASASASQRCFGATAAGAL